MNIRDITSLVLTVVFIFSTVFISTKVSAEEEVQTIEVHIDQENNKDAMVELIVDGAKEKFVLANLAKGETRTIVTESGKTITANKDQNGSTTVNIDGKDIKLFNFTGDIGADFNFVHGDEVMLFDDISATHSFDNKIMILGGNLTAEVKEALKATLASYNVTADVVFPDEGNTRTMFISSDELHKPGKNVDLKLEGNKSIRVIKKIESK
ncbi:hypothetical protein [Kangiella sp. HZ709]|uniref:hypothetical protein n=1 Tax=Kangiella sp. HZ709 TaxID=2666328 RepID=UPI0012B039CF|nr:hypothetical protein [Kangiella sp. HZ709]MRX26753.1 hypothetical protein [Kangiella sp. HZ709]